MRNTQAVEEHGPNPYYTEGMTEAELVEIEKYLLGKRRLGSFYLGAVRKLTAEIRRCWATT
jgi:hypothetical protein